MNLDSIDEDSDRHKFDQPLKTSGEVGQSSQGNSATVKQESRKQQQLKRLIKMKSEEKLSEKVPLSLD